MVFKKSISTHIQWESLYPRIKNQRSKLKNRINSSRKRRERRTWSCGRDQGRSSCAEGWTVVAWAEFGKQLRAPAAVRLRHPWGDLPPRPSCLLLPRPRRPHLPPGPYSLDMRHRWRSSGRNPARRPWARKEEEGEVEGVDRGWSCGVSGWRWWAIRPLATATGERKRRKSGGVRRTAMTGGWRVWTREGVNASIRQNFCCESLFMLRFFFYIFFFCLPQKGR